MLFLVPQLMENPQEIDKESFLALMLKKRPEYAILWDVSGTDLLEFRARVWVTQYIVVADNIAYYSQVRHYATRAKALLNLSKIVHVETDDQWLKHLPPRPEFRQISYYAPDIVEEPTTIAFEDFILKMLKLRPPYAVIWGVSLQEVQYIVSRVYVVSFMPIIDDILYYSYGKHFAFEMQQKFHIPHRKRIEIQIPLQILNIPA